MKVDLLVSATARESVKGTGAHNHIETHRNLDQRDAYAQINAWSDLINDERFPPYTRVRMIVRGI